MNIVIAGQTYHPTMNGQGAFTIHLAEGLAREGHQVTVFMPSDRVRAYRKTRNGVLIETITALPLFPLYSEVYVTPLPGLQVGSLLDLYRPQVVHIQDHYPLCRSVFRAAAKRKVSLVGTNHFLPENMVPYFPLISHLTQGRAFLRKILWKSVLDIFNHLDLVITPTETAAQILRQQDIQPPVCAISCGVDLKRFRPQPDVDRDRMRSRYGLDPQRILFLYVGRVDREKRLDVLLRAFHRLDRSDIQLAIAGKGVYLKALQSLSVELSLGEKVVFTGFVPDEDLPGLLNSADVFVMPSEAELQSIATLEAMGTGLPVLAADARALPELVENDVNGCLFRAGDDEDAARCVQSMADRREDWAGMRVASLARVQPHDLPNTIHRYEACYQSLL